MTASPRNLTVAYGPETFGSTTTRQIHGNLDVQKTARDFALEFQVLISATTDVNFSTDLAAIENAVRTPYQDLVVTFQGQQQYNFSVSSRRALNVVGEVLRRREAPGTRLAQFLTIRFTGDLPADRTAGLPTNILGLREGAVTTSFDEARIRTVTISGEWTAIPSPTRGAKTAYEHATAGIGAYASSVLNAISSTAAWELQGEETDLLDSDLDNLSEGGVLSFRRVYRELVFGQAGETLSAGVATGSVIRQVLQIRRTQENPGNSPGARPFRTAEVSYDCWLDRSQVSGSPGLENLWDQTIRPFVIDQVVRAGILAGAVAVLRTTPSFNYDENRISASLLAQGFGGPILDRRVSVDDFETGGKTSVQVWDGNPRSRFVFQGHIEKQRTILETVRVIRDFNSSEDFLANMGAGIVGEVEGILLEKRSSVTPIVIGSSETGASIRVLELQGRMVFQIFEKTDGARLRDAQGQDRGQSPFGFDPQRGLFELGGGSRGIGFADFGAVRVR